MHFSHRNIKKYTRQITQYVVYFDNHIARGFMPQNLSVSK